MSIIKLNNVSKFYYNKTNISTGFSKLSLSLDMGEFVVITGESGSGKSTLLNVISGLDSYEEGEMYINGEETSHYTEVDYENYRRKYIGNIFQHFNLVNSYTVYQNIELVLLLNGYKKREAKKKVLEIIDTVGLKKFKNTKASKLSGGQKQRVAIARALAKDTPIIVADEPTGNLDVQSAKAIMKLLKEISKSKLVVIVTHNYEQVEEYATRKISMNDGKIIEDKKIQEYEQSEPEIVKYKDLTVPNKVRLGFRNAFNIKTKFALLFFVYFFLTFLVFSEYSSLAKQNYDESLMGYNYYFLDVSPERVILKKRDKSVFTDEDIEKIKKLENIERVEKNDLLLDFNGAAYNDDVYFYGSYRDIAGATEVDEGTLDIKDDEIVITVNDYSYYASEYKGKMIGMTVNLQNNRTGDDLGAVKIAGVKYIEGNIYDDDSSIFVSKTMLDKINLGLSTSYSDMELSIGDRTYLSGDYTFYYSIQPNKNVADGEAFAFQDMNAICSDYSCINKKFNLKVSNIYFEDNKDFIIKKSLNKDNFKANTGLTNWLYNTNTIFISENDYNNLFYKGDYQISVFLSSTKGGDETIEKLKSLKYDTYYLKENLPNEMEQLMGIFRIFKTVVFIIATVALFFISFFIIRIILKSRNVYYSTIRILGATKKVSRQLLNIELFLDINIAFLVFLCVVAGANSGLITWNYVKDMITYFTLKDYIMVYIILCAMSLLISNRYAHKLFRDSVMSTYREEV